MSKNNNVVAITVTFNTSRYVIRTIEHLLKQTVDVNVIIIVDNNSKAEERQNIERYIKNIPQVVLLKLDENMGGAGGFFAGMEYAKKNLQPDWYWLMDDDSYPDRDCLENLIRYSTKNTGCMVPLVWGIDNNEYQLYHNKRESKFLTRDICVVEDEKRIDDVLKIEAASFVGPLFSKKAVEKKGIADGSLFIYGDDLEYTYRISREFDVCLVKTAVMRHQDVLKTGSYVKPQAWWKEYYQNRNRLFFIEKYAINKRRKINRKRYCWTDDIETNVGYIIPKEYKGIKMIRIRLLYKAWKDGNKNNRGKTVDPVEFNKTLEK